MGQPDQILPPLSRRDFHKLTLGAGAALATGNLISGCGSSDTTPPKVTYSLTNLHFDLSHLPSDAKHTLRVAGKRHTLTSHTTDSLKAAIVREPYLAGKQNVTHYVSGISMPNHKPLHFSVTSEDPLRGDCLALIGVNIPEQERARVRKSAAKSGNQKPSSLDKDSCKTVSAGVECTLTDQVSDNFITSFDAAKALVMHHTEIASLDTSVAAQVEAHIEASSAVANLSYTICQLGGAYVHDPNFLDGWCILVPLKNSDGTPRLDTHNNQMYDYQFNPLLNDDIRASIADVLSRIKNDPTLNGKMYTSYPHGSTESNSVTSKVAKRIQLWKSGGTQMTATETGYNHNVWFKAPTYTGSGTTRSFSLFLDNVNFIWYGLYIEYRDANGIPLSIPTWENDAINGLKIALDAIGQSSNWTVTVLNWLQSETIKFEGIISSPPTIFGVPLPAPVEVDITLPDGAVSARLMLCGPGVYGKVEYPPGLVAGILFTAVFNFCLPMYTLYAGTGLASTSTLWDIIKKPVTLFKIFVVLVKAAWDVFNPNSSNTLALVCSIESLLATVEQALIQVVIDGAFPEVTTFLTTETSVEEVTDAIPFVGWALRILTIAGTVADMATMVAEICTNPVVIDNIITFTNTVDITVNCDVGNNQFPEESTYYEVQFTVAGCTFPSSPKGFMLDQATRGNRTMTISIDSVPTTGLSTDFVEIWYYSDSNKGWLAAYGKSTFSNIYSSSSDLTAAITIGENPIPITGTTLYSQHRKLAYSGGKYFWQEGAGLTNPAIELSSCGGTGLCGLGNISVWVSGGMLGYTWQIGNNYKIKNVNSQEADPNPGMKLLDPSGNVPTPVVYDKTAPYNTANMTGKHFYLDPVNIDPGNPEYHLRKLNLDSGSTTFKTAGSWGRFRIPLDRIAVHPLGYVVGISTNHSKLAALELPAQAYPDDNHSNNAAVCLGYGIGDKLIQSPQAITISRTGAILILQGQNSGMSIKAYDIHGNPWAYFSNGTAFSFPLVSVDPNAQWLDIDIDDTELIFILSYSGTGTNQSDYHLDVYDKNGNMIVRNTGIAVYRMTVDKFRRVYSLNMETIKGSPMVEPSTSIWMPSIPTT